MARNRKTFFFKKAEISDIIIFWTRILKSKECSGDAPSPLPGCAGGSTIGCKIPCDGKGRGEPNLPVKEEISPRILPGTEIWGKTEKYFFLKIRKFRTLSFFGHAF